MFFSFTCYFHSHMDLYVDVRGPRYDIDPLGGGLVQIGKRYLLRILKETRGSRFLSFLLLVKLLRQKTFAFYPLHIRGGRLHHLSHLLSIALYELSFPTSQGFLAHHPDLLTICHVTQEMHQVVH